MDPITRSSSCTLPIGADVAGSFQCNTHCSELLHSLQLCADLCDVVLIAGNSGKRIHAHRLILIASSEYFSGLLRETIGENQVREIKLNVLDEYALESLVNYCYTGSLELRGNTVGALLATANHIQLKQVVKVCCEFLKRYLHQSNCLAVGFLAQQLNLNNLLQEARKFLCANFEEVSNNPDFLLLSVTELREVIASDELNVPSEEFVFEVVMRWIEYEPEYRRQHFTELLTQIRLPLLAPSFLEKTVEPLCNTIENQKLVLNALKSHLMPERQLLIQPRYNYKNLALIYISETEETKRNLAIARYNLHSKIWTQGFISTEHRLLSSVALYDNSLILAGGAVNDKRVNTVLSVNLQTFIQSLMAPLGTPRHYHTLAMLKGSIYAIGGFANDETLNSVERLDSVSRTWSFVAPMRKDRRRPAVASFNDQLYVSGGYVIANNRRARLTSAECYNPIWNMWTTTASMNVGRFSHCLAAYKGYLFAIGGCSSVHGTGFIHDAETLQVDMPVERYDPRTDTWTEIPCSTVITGYTKCAALGPDVFIYNKGQIYTISRESESDRLELLKVTEHNLDGLKMNMYCIDLIATPIFPAASFKI